MKSVKDNIEFSEEQKKELQETAKKMHNNNIQNILKQLPEPVLIDAIKLPEKID